MNHPPSQTLLRLARADQAPAMARLSRDLIETGLSWKYTPSRIAELIADADTVALVACNADHLAGFAVMHFLDEHAHLVLLCVQPSHQRCGLGRALNDWLVASARVAGIGAIHLELRADNHPALAFYRSLGWSVTQRVPAYYGANIDALRMVRWLRQDAALT